MECNTNEAKSRNIPIIRRYSGGGTVYHDLGNVNYSLHRDKSLFNRTFAAELIIKSLKGHEPNLYLSPRHDIFLKSFKVSGSAYKLTKDRAYHHGTLLLCADLENIDKLLKSPLNILKRDDEFRFGGVSSVPSPVTNIPNQLSFEKLLKLIENEFDPTDPIIKFATLDGLNDLMKDSNCTNKIKEYINELESWNWVFAKSPPFKVLIDNSELLVESGIIKDSNNPIHIGKRFMFD